MTKRARGSVYLRGADSRWVVSLQVRDPYTQKIKRITQYPEPNTKEAGDTLLARLIYQSDQGAITHGGDVLLKTHAHKWLDEVVRPRLKPNTIHKYEVLLKVYVIGELGDYRLRDITTTRVHEFHTTLRKKGLSSNTVSQVHQVLCACLKQALVWDMLSRNVASLVHPPPVRVAEMHVWTAEEAAAFLVSTRNKPLHPLYAVALMLGMRKGEILGLRWQDINLEACTLSVNGQLLKPLMGKPAMRGTTKTGNVRTLDIPTSLIPILREHKAGEIEKHNLFGKPWDFGCYVFTNPTTGPAVHAVVYNTFVTDTIAAGLPVIRFHDLRHTVASILYSKGIPVATISKMLGHASSSITLNTYTHIFQSAMKEAADAMGSILG